MLTLDPPGVTRETVTITLPSTLWRLAAFSLIIAMGKKQPSVVTLTESKDYGIIRLFFFIDSKSKHMVVAYLYRSWSGSCGLVQRLI